MKKSFLLLFLIILCGMSFSEEKIISIDQERKDKLLYGIDSEVKELIALFTKEKISGFDVELNSMLNSTFDDEMKIIILEYFILMEINSGEETALKIYEAIEYEDEYSDKYAKVAIKYLSNIKSSAAIEGIPVVLQSENEAVLISILKLIGENELIKHEEHLLQMLDDDEIEDQIYLEVIKTLGKVKSKKALELLIPIADDVDEETTIRNAVCFSLGEIGDKKAIPVLKRCLGDQKNYLLRKSALDALGKFETSEMEDILISALRDNHWQLRYTACKSLGERKASKAFPALKFMSLHDPEVKINKQAFDAIGEIDSEECREFLKAVFTEDSYKDGQKVLAIEKLVEHNVDWIFPSIETLYNEKHLEKRKPLLDATLKFLSEKEYKYASDLYGKMLGHENYLYKLLAIKGIRLNKYSEHKEQIETLSENDKNKNVKKHALSALEEL